jgi:hypothetical protein
MNRSDFHPIPSHQKTIPPCRSDSMIFLTGSGIIVANSRQRTLHGHRKRFFQYHEHHFRVFIDDWHRKNRVFFFSLFVIEFVVVLSEPSRSTGSSSVVGRRIVWISQRHSKYQFSLFHLNLRRLRPRQLSFQSCCSSVVVVAFLNQSRKSSSVSPEMITLSLVL